MATPISLNSDSLRAAYKAKASETQDETQLVIWAYLEAEAAAGRKLRQEPAPLRAAPLDAPLVEFTYRNHEGKISRRRVRPRAFEILDNEHYRGMWGFRAWDCDRQAERTFAFDHIVGAASPAVVAMQKQSKAICDGLVEELTAAEEEIRSLRALFDRFGPGAPGPLRREILCQYGLKDWQLSAAKPQEEKEQ